MKKCVLCFVAVMSLSYASLEALSSTRGITAVIKNETPQQFLVKLVNLESSQEMLVQVLNAKGIGRDVISIIVPPELFGITILYPPNGKTTNISTQALRGMASCGQVQITLRPRIYVGEPQIELGAPANCTILEVNTVGNNNANSAVRTPRNIIG